MYQVPCRKYWNTWSSQSPAIMEFLPAGFSIKLGAYSFSKQSYTNFPFSKSTTLFEHHPDGNYCRLQVEHAGTILELEYFKTDDWTVLGRLRVVKNGEWGLRFITVLSFGFDDNTKVFNDNGSFHGCRHSYEFALSLKYKPVRDCYVDNSDILGQQMEKLGYYTPMPTSDNPKIYSIMYNLEETPEAVFSVSVANSYNEAKKKADLALDLVSESDENNSSKLDELKKSCFAYLTRQTKGEHICSTEAIRDVMAWNTIADRINNRVFTSLTRFWIDKKFGGWYIWLDDILMHGLMNAWAGDWSMGRGCIKAAMDNNTPAGNFACLMAEFTEWVDRSQPPIFSFIVYKYYLLTQDRQLIEEVFPALLKSHLWWYENRDGNGNGVLEYGSSQVGNGHFNGTKLAAKDEAAMDNSPMYDSARFMPECNTINMEDIALNSLLTLDGECLALLSDIRGDSQTAEMLRKKSDALKDRVNVTLWDEERDIYANRHWEKGFVCPTPTSFYPMAAGIPDESRVEKLISHIFDESEFWTEFPLPSVWLKDPSVNDNVYWRGRSWPPLNFFTYIGLKRYGRDKEATRLISKIMEHFSSIWEKERYCYENHNTFTGEGSDSVDSDPFYGWGALYSLMWIFEHIDIDPWNGFHFGSPDGSAYDIEGLRMGDGVYSLSCYTNKTILKRNCEVIFETDAVGRFRHFTHGSHYGCVTVPAQKLDCTVHFPTVSPIRLIVNGNATDPCKNIAVKQGENTKIELWY